MQRENLYKLNWSAKDNPIGWIEPTIECQLNCTGCYRKLEKNNHKSLEEMKFEVDWHIHNRNVRSLSIAGGDPLLYPHLNELIKYIKDQGIKSSLNTNGILLSEERLLELKECGLNEVVLHIDKLQHKNITEEQLIEKREKVCNLFRKRQFKSISLGFIMMVSKDNISELKGLSKFYRENSDVVKHLVFCNFKSDAFDDDSPNKHMEIHIDYLVEKIEELFGIEFCAYLGRAKSDTISWLFAVNLYDDTNKEFLKSMSGEEYIEIETNYLDSLKRIRNEFGRRVNIQTLIIIEGPYKMENGEIDYCGGCPDATIYGDKLVPSCLLERAKLGEDVVITKIN